MCMRLSDPQGDAASLPVSQADLDAEESALKLYYKNRSDKGQRTKKLRREEDTAKGRVVVGAAGQLLSRYTYEAGRVDKKLKTEEPRRAAAREREREVDAAAMQAAWREMEAQLANEEPPPRIVRKDPFRG